MTTCFKAPKNIDSEIKADETSLLKEEYINIQKLITKTKMKKFR